MTLRRLSRAELLKALYVGVQSHDHGGLECPVCGRRVDWPAGDVPPGPCCLHGEREVRAWLRAHPAPDPWFPDERTSAPPADVVGVRLALPEDHAARKAIPLCTGALDYFPAAIAAVAELSRIGNEQHNPGEPMHHARGKSSDHADCIVRHLLDRGQVYEVTIAGKVHRVRHSVAVAWRALALAQEELEREEGAPLARGAKAAP